MVRGDRPMLRGDPRRGRAGLWCDIREAPALVTFVGVLVEWGILGAIAHRGVAATMEATLSYACFILLVGFGQMLVIALGNGNIDLSIPAVMSLSAIVGVAAMGAGSTTDILIGLLVSVGVGICVGLVNAGSILLLRVPPLIVTLAVGLVADALALVRTSSGEYASVPPGFVSAVSIRFLGIGVLTWVCLGLSPILGVIVHRTVFGRSVSAIGQNRSAAWFAGVREGRTIVVAYLISGVLAALSGVCLAAYAGLSLDLGTPYLLTSIAAVILGGSLITGGRSTVIGVWAGALFLGLALALLEVANTGVPGQYIGEGVLIFAVLGLSRANQLLIQRRRSHG